MGDEAVARELASKYQDPVYETGSGWWHYDETWAQVYGPWKCEMQARKGLFLYHRWLNSPKPEHSVDLSPQ